MYVDLCGPGPEHHLGHQRDSTCRPLPPILVAGISMPSARQIIGGRREEVIGDRRQQIMWPQPAPDASHVRPRSSASCLLRPLLIGKHGVRRPEPRRSTRT